MEEREISDREFEAGLRAVLGDHFQDLTEQHRETMTPVQKERCWEWACWSVLWALILMLAVFGR